MDALRLISRSFRRLPPARSSWACPAGPLACRRQEPVTAARGDEVFPAAGAAGTSGSGRLAIQRRRRKARSLSAWLPKRAVPMTVSATASSIAIATWPSRGSATPMPAGAQSEGEAARPLRPRAWRGPVCSFRPRRSRCRRPRRRWRVIVGEVPQDGADFVGEADSDRELFGEPCRVPVHLGHQQHLGEERLGGGVADVVGDLHGGRDVAVRVAAE